jgi:hypothetical protein
MGPYPLNYGATLFSTTDGEMGPYPLTYGAPTTDGEMGPYPLSFGAPTADGEMGPYPLSYGAPTTDGEMGPYPLDNYSYGNTATTDGEMGPYPVSDQSNLLQPNYSRSSSRPAYNRGVNYGTTSQTNPTSHTPKPIRRHVPKRDSFRRHSAHGRIAQAGI